MDDALFTVGSIVLGICHNTFYYVLTSLFLLIKSVHFGGKINGTVNNTNSQSKHLI